MYKNITVVPVETTVESGYQTLTESGEKSKSNGKR